MSRLHRLTKNFLALLLGVILAFVVTEGVLRIYNPFEFRVKGDKIVLPVNKKYVIKKKRSRTISSSKFDTTIVHTKNSLGFRGEEPPANFSDFLKIITIGGSTTECTYLSDGKTWTDVLGKKLKTNFDHLWINNAGFDGQSTFGHIVLMEDYIVKLRPQIILFLTGANDQNREDLGEQDMEIMRDRFDFYSIKGFLKSMANHSEVFSLGLNFYRYWKSVEIGVDHNELDFRIYKNVDISKYMTDEYLGRKKDALTSEKKYAKPFAYRLQKLINISRDHGIEPILITQPSFYGNFIDDVTNVDFKFTEISWEILEIFNNVTRQVGKENNILVIDLAREMPKSSKYYYDWLHYTNEGAEKVAEIVYNNLYPYMVENHRNYLNKKS